MLDRFYPQLYPLTNGSRTNRRRRKEAARAKDENSGEPGQPTVALRLHWDCEENMTLTTINWLGIDKARISAAKDLLFIAFHVYLISQFYLIYGGNIAIWDGVQLILSSILVVGDPLFHSMQPFRLKNCWEDNLEPMMYFIMLIITATRSILYPRNGSVSNFLALTCWFINKAR